LRKVLILAFIAVVAALVNAAVFVYYPITVSITGYQPIVFDYGSNANQPDLWGDNYINVTLGLNGASVAIAIHPTYQHTYYHNVTLVKNVDYSKSYYLAFRVTQPVTGWPDESVVKMIIYSSDGVKIGEVDLKQSYTTSWIGPLNAGDYYRIDFYIYYPEGYRLPRNTQIQLQLVYSPQNIESPPTIPP